VKRRWAAMLVAVVALTVVFAPQAYAAQRPAQDGSVNVDLFAKGSDGYEAELASEGDKLRLSFSRGLLPALIYAFHGRVTAEGIQARIADLGTVELRFVATPGKTKKSHVPGRCGGGTVRVNKGHFVGRLDFRAELGAAKLDLSRAEGWVISPGWHCPNMSFKEAVESQSQGATYTLLRAEDKADHVTFGASAGTDAEHPEPVGSEIAAGMITRRGPVKVDHLAMTLATHAFSFDAELASATVTPPEPFTGQATYCASCAPGSRWTGDLKVTLPGISGKVSLVGPAFDPSMKRIESGGDAAESKVSSP
jgi:hypothetical protein